MSDPPKAGQKEPREEPAVEELDEEPWLPEFSEETFGPSPEFVQAV